MSFLRTCGQFLYNLYDIPFKPGALPAQALWTKSRTSFSFIPLLSNITVGSWGFGKSLRGGIGIPFNHLSMLSSNDSRVPPSVHQACHSLIPRKVFLRKHKDLSYGLSWIGASFNRRFSILCSDLNFPFCICRLFGRFPSVLSFLSVTAPNHSKQTLYITLQKDDN